MKALSLYTGAGGFDLGLEAAGFTIVGCVEDDPDARRTLETSTDWPLLAAPETNPGDVLSVEPEEVLEEFALKPREVTLLAGGPPCQPFSKASLWVAGSTSRMLDPRAKTLRAYFQMLEAALPETMLLENVAGMTYAPRADKSREEAVDLLNAELKRINKRHGTSYRAHVLSIDAADYGVPQKRERVFIFASRDGDAIVRPQPTHAAEPKDQHRFANCWDAIGDLDSDDESPEELIADGKWAKLLPSIPEGSNYLWHTPRGGGEPLFGWRTRYWSFLLKLAKNRPSWTIQASPGPATGPFHWRSRQLSVREMARLQTLPDGYTIAGSYFSARRQLGNAVPAAVGELLGLEILSQIYGSSRPEDLALIPELLDTCPEPEKTHRVPAKYRDLRGQHKDHAGPGTGPGARKRAAGVKQAKAEIERAAEVGVKTLKEAA